MVEPRPVVVVENLEIASDALQSLDLLHMQDRLLSDFYLANRVNVLIDRFYELKTKTDHDE